jgi:four helix bundle protein
MMRDHSRLKVFHLADSLALDVYEATKSFPRSERYGLADQLRRAAGSVAAIIVEGAARNSLKDYAHMLSIAYASAKELQYEITLSDRLGCLSADAAERLNEKASETSRALWSLVSVLRTRASTDSD